MHGMTTPKGPQLQLIRKYLLRLVIGLYYALHIAERPERTQQTFVAVWVVLTLLIVSTLMKKIRQARRGQL